MAHVLHGTQGDRGMSYFKMEPHVSLRTKVATGQVDCGNMCISMPLSAHEIRQAEEQLNIQGWDANGSPTNDYPRSNT